MFCITVTKYTDYLPKDYCFDVIYHALKIQKKKVVQKKLKHVITGFYYLLHMQALKKTQ